MALCYNTRNKHTLKERIMPPIEIAAQIIGVFAMALNIWSYQQKKQRFIIALQLLGSTLFTAHFFMLGAYMGGLLNAVGIVRAIVFLYKDKLKSDHILWLILFICVYLASYVFTFTVLGKAWNFPNAVVEILPVIGMTATTFAFRAKTAKTTRLLGLISSPSWLIYNIVNLSIGAICCEVFSLISIIVGWIRFDRKKRDFENHE